MWDTEAADGARQVLEIEQRRRAALVAGDVEQLAALLSDALVHVHASGTVDDKASFLAKVADGRLRFVEVVRESARVCAEGPVAVVNGRITTMLMRPEGAVRSRTIATQFWASEGHAKRLVLYHATRLPPSPV